LVEITCNINSELLSPE